MKLNVTLSALSLSSSYLPAICKSLPTLPLHGLLHCRNSYLFLNFHSLFILLQDLMLMALLLLTSPPCSVSLRLLFLSAIFATLSPATASICLSDFSCPMSAFLSFFLFFNLNFSISKVSEFPC